MGSGTESSKREWKIIVGGYLMLFEMPLGSETEIQNLLSVFKHLEL